MASSQDLVPTNLPYGSRQQTVAQMQAADIPLNSADGGGGGSPPAPPAVASPSPVAPATPVSRAGLQGFDALANRQPTPNFDPSAASDPVEVLRAHIESSPNESLRYYFARVGDFLR
jgi:hypothetical protein